MAPNKNAFTMSYCQVEWTYVYLNLGQKIQRHIVINSRVHLINYSIYVYKIQKLIKYACMYLSYLLLRTKFSEGMYYYASCFVCKVNFKHRKIFQACTLCNRNVQIGRESLFIQRRPITESRFWKSLTHQSKITLYNNNIIVM